jgi:hypothetical protein
VTAAYREAPGARIVVLEAPLTFAGLPDRKFGDRTGDRFALDAR